jgi:hypothetical protein
VETQHQLVQEAISSALHEEEGGQA